MRAIEFDGYIDENGRVRVPEEHRHAYGKRARLVVLLDDQPAPSQTPRQPGSAKGVLRVVSEDDEHLDDFREYMQ